MNILKIRDVGYVLFYCSVQLLTCKRADLMNVIITSKFTSTEVKFSLQIEQTAAYPLLVD